MPVHAMLAALIVAISWGGNYSASRFALMDFPPFLMLSVRFLLVIGLLAPFAVRHKRPPLKQMLFLSVVLVTLQFGLMFYAMHFGMSITAGIIATQLGVPFSCLVAALMFKDRLGPWRMMGLVVAFSGVLVICGTPDVMNHPFAFALALGASLAWCVANLYLKTIEAPHGIPLLFWPGLLALPQLMALSWMFEEHQASRIVHAGTAAWGGVTYSALISSILGYGLWNWLMTRFPVSRVMPFGLLLPVFGIGFGAWFFDEHLTRRILLGGGMTMMGVAIITLRRPKLATTEH